MKCLSLALGVVIFLPTGREGSGDFGGVIVTSTCFSHKALYVPYSPLFYSFSDDLFPLRFP